MEEYVMRCVVFTNPRFYSGVTQIGILCDDTDVRDGWLIILLDEVVVASFSKESIFGWMCVDPNTAPITAKPAGDEQPCYQCCEEEEGESDCQWN